ncbi:protein YgfX [Pseudomonas cremoricolorata]|uniref:protein YgfX n=1 Tax=Pseudomonas cremoricolorata TaxID=157783 RepID=UPI000420B956|nr:protein YgfX [Pseudomonas cremoricolorata]
MSSPSDTFECRWHGSRRLLTAYLACQALAACALALSAAPGWLLALAVVLGAAHACWVIPRRILLTHPTAITALRRSPRGWQLFSRRHGWQPVRLCRDSVAVPGLVVLRYVRQGRRLSESQCVMGDALCHEQHRRLRVRLTFSRRRWQAP